MIAFKHLQFDFRDKTVLVVGGSRGIGKGITDAFLDAGASVYYAARNPADDKSEATFIRSDLTKTTNIENLFSEMEKVGGVDIVINAAAVNYCKPMEEISMAEWDEVMAVNLRAVFLICKLAVNTMKKKRYGKIVNISSIAGRHRSIVSGVHYVSSKAGLIGLTRQVAYLAAQYNINVNAVCPSQTMTDMLKESMSDEQIVVLADSIPLNRVATVKEQVGPVLFLCSDAASYITGTIIDVNGGQI